MPTILFKLFHTSEEQSTDYHNEHDDNFNFRYGNEVGTATENALTTAGNAYLTAYNTTALAPKALVKRAAKTTGKLAVGVPEEAILGRKVAENDESKDAEPKALKYDKGQSSQREKK